MSDLYLTSGSAVERALICDASVALPHAHFESIYTTRGTVIHSFLEDCTKMDRETALAGVPEEYRDACAELNLYGVDEHLRLAAEVAIAYNVRTDTARELGRGAGRAYDDVTEDEIPCTLDLVGVRDLPNGRRRGLYADWKSGWSTRRAIDAVVQIDFGALAIARLYGCDEVDGQLIHVHEDLAPWVQTKKIAGWEIDAFAAELRERHMLWLRLREQWRDGILPRDYNTGPWCERCGAREFCPAQTSMLRSVMSREVFDGLLRMSPIPDDALAEAWYQVHAAQSVLSLVKGKILGIASTRKIFLGKSPDGERWIGPVLSEGNDKIDGEIAFDVIAELHGDDVATKATKVTATKKGIGEAIRDAVPRGQKAVALKMIYDELKKRPGGITFKTETKPQEFLLKNANPTATQLAEATGESDADS